MTWKKWIFWFDLTIKKKEGYQNSGLFAYLSLYQTLVMDQNFLDIFYWFLQE